MNVQRSNALTSRTDSQEHHQQTQHSINSHFQYITVDPFDSLTHKKTKQNNNNQEHP